MSKIELSGVEVSAVISDKLAGKLSIVALDFAKGLWCFRDELSSKTRKSYPRA